MPAEAAIHDLLGALSALVSCDLLFWTRFDVQTPYKIAEVGYPHAPLTARSWCGGPPSAPQTHDVWKSLETADCGSSTTSPTSTAA
jgi:hypothetical protein